MLGLRQSLYGVLVLGRVEMVDRWCRLVEVRCWVCKQGLIRMRKAEKQPIK